MHGITLAVFKRCYTVSKESIDRYNELIHKLDAFVRKYYKNQIIKGLLYSVGLVLMFYLVAAVLEYFGNFGSTARTILFYGVLAVALVIATFYIFVPLMRLLRMGKTISHAEASAIIGKHFSSVKDKLLNVLQLESLSHQNQSELVMASIDQKITELKPVPFTEAIDYRENRRYLKIALPPLVILLLLLIGAPNVLTESTNRIVRHSEAFEPVAPFQFIIENQSLESAAGNDFKLQIRLEGNEIPENTYLLSNGQRLKMKKGEKFEFNHTFNALQKDVLFEMEAGGFRSESHLLKALPAPVLLHFQVSLSYPAYTGQAPEVFKNMGNLHVPEGTEVKWRFSTKNVDDLAIWLDDKWHHPNKSGSDIFDFSARAMQNQRYAIRTANEFVTNADSIPYRIQVVRDQYPSVDVEERDDSTSTKLKYFNGLIKDDYGFTRLTFNYRFTETTDSLRSRDLVRQQLGLASNQNQQQFFHYWNVGELNLKAGEEIEYYFEVWDNDGVNGAKSSRSSIKKFKAPSKEELTDQRDKSNEKIKDDLEKSIQDAVQIQKELEELNKDLLERKELTWQDKKKLEELLSRQEQMQSRVEQLKNEQKQSNQKQQEYSEMNEKLLEKQQRLEELFDELMSDEMKEMFERMQELMEKLDKDEIQKELEQMQWDQKDMEKDLDRALEQFKQMEMEMKMEETIEKLDELAKEQEELSEEGKKEDSDSDELKEKQDFLNEKFEQLREDLEELHKKNEELENPMDLDDTKEQEESIEEDMEDSSDELEKGNKGDASEKQQDAATQMKQMANQMASQMAAGQEEGAQEDMDDLRKLLNNIITLSFDQEDIMTDLLEIDGRDPKYRTAAQDQRKLKDDAKMVEDSLFALSKRVEELQGIVNREISSINQNMATAIEHLSERETPQARSNQQYVMTSLNNLALLLDEALQQMQMKMASQMPGTGNCQKPGGKGSKPSPSSIKKMQEAMGKKISEMEKMLGENKGKSGKGQSGGMSKDLAKMAAEQAAIRKEVERMAQEMNKDGSGSGKQLSKLAQEMEELEKDIVNKNIRPETLKRQQDIMTRLLESERAEREREQEKKRESQQAKDYSLSNPSQFFEYNQRKQREIELLKTMPPSLKPYYKNKVNEYFIKFDQ